MLVKLYSLVIGKQAEYRALYALRCIALYVSLYHGKVVEQDVVPAR